MWIGIVFINWNHNKSMRDTIDTMFVNEKIIRIYSHHETQDKCILRWVLRQKPA